MDRGELWEQGPPEQIFEHPRRKETHDFIFRVRTWSWEIHDVDYDYPGMKASLRTFCARQFLGRHVTLACELVVDEIASRFLVPGARALGVADPDISLELSIGEGGDRAELAVDCRSLVAAGLDREDVEAAADDVSQHVLGNLTTDHSLEEPGSDLSGRGGALSPASRVLPHCGGEAYID